MKIADSLLIAPLAFCVAGGVLGVLTDVGFSSLCIWIMAASLASFALHRAVSRPGRRSRPNAR